MSRELIREAGKVFGVDRSAFIFDSDFWSEVTYELILNSRRLTRDEILSYIRKYIGKLDWEFLSENFIFKGEELEEFVDVICWDTNGSKCQILSEDFIKKHWNELDHSDISVYQTLSENFIFEYINELDLDSIIACQVVSEEFIDRLNNNPDKAPLINWFDVSRCVILSPSGLRQYKDYLNSDLVFKYQPFINDDVISLYIKKYSISDLSRRSELLLRLHENIYYNQRKKFGYDRSWFISYFYYHNRDTSPVSDKGYEPINIIDRGYINGLIKGRAYYKDLLRPDWVKDVEVINKELGKDQNIYKRL